MGNPTFRWDHMKENGYRWWMDRLRRAFSLYDRVRLDHFLGFHSYFSIPRARPAPDGRWLAGPGKDLFQTAYEELGPLNFIAEDLGYLTPVFAPWLRPAASPAWTCWSLAITTSATGLTPRPARSCIPRRTTRRRSPVGARAPLRAATEPSGKEFAGKLMGDALASDAPLVMMPLQDVLGLGDDARMNVPGVATGNWTWQADEADIEAAEEKTAQLLRNTHRFWGEA